MGSIDFGKMQLLQTPICRNVVYQFSNFVSRSALSDLSTEDPRSQIYDARALSRDSPQVASRTHLTNQFAGKNSSLSHRPRLWLTWPGLSTTTSWPRFELRLLKHGYTG